MGDVIHTLPALALLRRALPKAEITWAMEPHWRPLLEGNPAVDRIVEVPLKRWRGSLLSGQTRAGFRALRAQLGSSQFDLAIDFQGLLKSAILGRAAKPRRLAGFARAELREGLAAWFYTDGFPANRRHVVDKNLALVRAIAGAPDGRAPAAFLPAGERRADLPAGDFVLASPLAGWKSKQWPPERYADLAELAWAQRRLPLVFDGAPADRAYLEAIAAQAPEGSCRVHVSSLPELIGATRAARAVVGLDSGPLHLAAAIGQVGVALFGPTDPERNGPHGGRFRVLRWPDADTSYKREDRFAPSMLALTPEGVWGELTRVLDARPRPLEVISGGG